ncbi:MAG: UDP-N-acetylglucosamine--N-acetylmuramyl-(pentapeptide) pyrophosphoryl-undecaprenol N-acetylglucosamine transferase [bacterium]|nr:UDP-N-acetylglucosamine--N-acetylmuramyl-(pentapeptide) pyrophosphoryl-undecaprenol N-acetylglucosamine transferase [bacterium]
MKTVIFTGGHHTSSLVVAKAMQAKGWRVFWFGHRYSMWGDTADSAEYREVTAAKIEFHNLLAGKFYRTYNPFKLIRIPFGFIHALLLLIRLRPAGIVSFGGYLAVPTVICGWLLGIPAITHEQTVVEGWANKVVSRFANKVAVTWPVSLKLFPKNKGVFVGLPLRPEIKALKKKGVSKKIYDPITVFITGGKQGSHVLNRIIFDNFNQLGEKYNMIHQTGTSTVYHDYARAQELHLPNYEAFDFDSHKWIAALGRADVVVSRAGAHSVYELSYLGKRSVLIPIPWVSHDEQTKNARQMETAGLAVVLPEKDLTFKSLMTAIDKAKHFLPEPVNLPDEADETMVQLIEQEFNK